MQLIRDLLSKLETIYPKYSFVAGESFKWSYAHQTITYSDILSVKDICLLAHELGHAELNHENYSLDVDLLKQESAAWSFAKDEIAPILGITIDQSYIEECLDTYRNWMHGRSLCPQCNMSGMQQKTNNYSCFNCSYLWRVNDARACGLKRTRLQDH